MTVTTRPNWEHTNNLTKPNTVLVAPSFKDELGVVFIGIGENSPGISTDGGWSGEHKGIWLDRPTAEAMARAILANADWAETHGEWCDDDCACQS